MKKTIYMMLKKDLLETEDQWMKQDFSEKKIPSKRKRQSLLKAIFLKLKREDVV